MPLSSTQLLEEVRVEQPEFGLQRIVSQGPGRLHGDLGGEDHAGERTVVGCTAGQSAPVAALLALQYRLFRGTREDVRLACWALHLFQSLLPLFLSRSRLYRRL